MEAAADRAEAELGPIDVWVNVAMATVFSPVAKLTAEEVERGTKVTYLGQVHGMMSALKRMRVRNRGTIVNVGSALAYRSVPLQSIYCGAKAAIRGFTDSLRSEIIHDKLDVIAQAKRAVTCVIIPNDLQELEYEDAPMVHGATHTGVGYPGAATLPYVEDIRS